VAATGVPHACGRFGADMQVTLLASAPARSSAWSPSAARGLGARCCGGCWTPSPWSVGWCPS
jgi:hypothetical protein